MAYRDYYSGGKPTVAPRQKKKSSGGGGGFLGDIESGIGDALSGVDNAFGVGNLAKMAWNFLPGIYNLGHGLVTDPVRTTGTAGRAIAGSFLSTADTLSGGLADKQINQFASSIDASVPGQKIAPAWNRPQGLLPGITEDVLNVAAVANPAAASADAAEAGAVADAASAAEAGDTAAQAAHLQRAEDVASAGAKWKAAAHPFRTMWRAAIREPAAAAVDAKLAAAGVDGAAGEVPETPTQPVSGESEGTPQADRRSGAPRTTDIPLEAGQRFVLRDTNGREITAVGDLGQDADLAERTLQSEQSRHNGSYMNVEDSAGQVVHQGEARQVEPATEVGTEGATKFTVKDPTGRPILRTPDMTEAKAAAEAIEKEGKGPATIEGGSTESTAPAAPHPVARAGETYAEANGLDNPATILHGGDVPPEMADLSEQYRTAPDATGTPEMDRSYAELEKHTMAQAEHALGRPQEWEVLPNGDVKTPSGVTLTFEGGEDVTGSRVGGYQDAAEMRADLENNAHLKVRNTAAAGDTPNAYMSQPVLDATGTPIRVPVNGVMEPLVFNDVFRAVHDIYGHAATNDFGNAGEVTAWRAHDALFPEEAKQALANETINQTAHIGEHPELGFPPQRAVNVNPETLDAIRQAGETQNIADAAAATVREDALSPNGVGQPATQTQDPAMTAQQAAENTAEAQAEVAQEAHRNPFARFLYGAPSTGEETLPLHTRIMAGVGERLEAADLRNEINVQKRYATAARAIALQSEPVRASIEVAKTFILPYAEDGQEASRIVGDEITSRLNGIRSYADAHGVPDETAIQLGWRNEALPRELLEDPAKMADFNQAIDASTELWRQERKSALEELMKTRLGSKGLKAVGNDDPILTKTEQRTLKDADKMLAKAEQMTGAVERERLRAERQVAGMEDLKGKIASQIESTQGSREEAVAAFDRSRSGLPAIWRDAKNAGRWTARVEDMIARLTDPTSDFRGFTYDPATDAYVTGVTPKGRYVVGLLPGAEGIPVEQLTPELIDNVARYYQQLYDGDTSIMLGAWEDDGKVFIEPSQVVKTRSEALTLGQSRGQQTIWDFGADGDGNVDTNFGRPDVAGQFAGSRVAESGKAVSNHTFRDRFATQAYEAASKTRNTPEDVDHWMALNDSVAARWGEVTGKHPDEYYRDLAVRFKQRPPRGVGLTGRLFQTVLPHTEPTSDLFEQARQAGVDIDTARKWYFRSHDAIEKAFRGKDITLLNGHTMDQADLVYELLAVSSVSAAPLDNLASALTGVANMHDFNGTFGRNLVEVKRLVKDFEDMGAKRFETASGRGPALRTESELFQALGEGTHQMYNGPKYHAFEILSGHTIAPYEGWDGWTSDYLRQQPEQFGGATKGLPDAKVTDADVQHYMDTFGVDEARARDLAIREYHGSSALAKILSFHDNLANPATSQSVTLDSWMSRLFGDANWLSKGTYRHYSDAMRDIADDLSATTGETVRPHEVQAVFWAYAKQEISRQNVGILHAYAADALDQIEAGTWTPQADPIIDWHELEAGPLREAEEAKQPNRDYLQLRRNKASALRRALKKTGLEGDELEKAVKKAVGEDEEVRAEAAKIKEHKAANPSRKVTERTVPVIRTEGDVRDAQALVPENETNLHVVTAKKADVISDKLAAGERYQTTTQADIADALRAGDQQEASRILTAWTNSKASNIRDEGWGDFQDMMDSPNGERLPAAIERLRQSGNTAFDELHSRIKGEILGSTTLARTPEARLTIELFQNADFTTLVHEGAHVLRQMLPEEDLKLLGASYGIKYSRGAWTWTREAEERFANDFTGYLGSGAAKAPHLQGVFARLRNELLTRYFHILDNFQRNRMGASIPDGTKALLNRYLNPDTAELSDTPGFTVPEEKPAWTDRKLAGEARTTPPVQGGPAKMYRSGVESGRAIEQYMRLGAKELELRNRYEEVTRLQNDTKQAIIEGDLPRAKAQAALRGKASKTIERVVESTDNPSLSRVPAHWQPLYQAAQSLAKLAGDNPELAAEFGEINTNLSSVIEEANARGLVPEHVASFTPQQVHRLVYQTMRLGKGGERLGDEIAAGTRYARSYRGVRATSIESLASAALDVTHEARTNAVVDFVENKLARHLDGGEPLPKDWVFWGPRKNSLLSDVDVKTGELTARQPEGGLIIPKAADEVLRRYSQDYSHGVFKLMNKAISPWRTFVLTLSPKWYLHRIFGNILLASLDGVKLQDWVKAWGAKGDSVFNGVRDEEMAQFGSNSWVHGEASNPSLVPNATSFREAISGADGAVPTAKAAYAQAKAGLMDVHDTIDQFARTAAYFKHVRTGATAEEALNRATTAFADYNSLSPFEQGVVKSVLPFYAWQKSLFKIGLLLPVDHPLLTATAFWLNRFNAETQREQFGTQLPAAYQSIVKTPFGPFNLSMMNPIGTADTLGSSQGIVSATNPLLQIALRQGLNAPNGPSESVNIMGDLGTKESSVSIPAALAGTGTGLPQARLGGIGDYPGYGKVPQVLNFAGVPVVTDAQLKKITTRTKATVNSLAGKKTKRKSRKRKSKTNPYGFKVSKSRNPSPFRRTSTGGIRLSG